VPDDNVVRFPRDWFGPRDELVPFGPSARADAETSETEAPWSADDFWGGEAETSAHDVVAGDDCDSGRRAFRLRRPGWPWPAGSHLRARVNGRIAARAALGLTAAAVLATVLVSVGTRGRPKPGPARHAAAMSRPRLDASVKAALARHPSNLLAGGNARTSHKSSSHLPRPVMGHRQRISVHRRSVQKKTVTLQPVGYTTPSSEVATTPSGSSASSTTSSSSPATASAPATHASSGGSSGGSSASSNHSATGANGTLGPGSSPDS
jgi:hypothetical protein